MTELMALIQAHLDCYGVTRAEFARRAGTNPQTVHNWAGRLKALPEARHLHGVAEVIGQPYLVVLAAALVDAGYRDSMVDDVAALKSALRRAAAADPRVLDEIGFTVNQLRAEHAAGDIAEDVSEDAESRRVADLIAGILTREFSRGQFQRDDGGDGGQ